MGPLLFLALFYVLGLLDLSLLVQSLNEVHFLNEGHSILLEGAVGVAVGSLFYLHGGFRAFVDQLGQFAVAKHILHSLESLSMAFLQSIDHQ